MDSSPGAPTTIEGYQRQIRELKEKQAQDELLRQKEQAQDELLRQKEQAQDELLRQKEREQSKLEIQQEREQSKLEREGRNRAERQIEKTNLLDFMDAAHKHLYSNITVNTNPNTTTQGSHTNPKGKLCPAHIREWHEFSTDQNNIWETLARVDPAFVSEQHFDSLAYLETAGGYIYSRPISSEKDLESVTREVIEYPVASVLTKLSAKPRLAKAFGLEGKLAFENHANGLDEEDDEETAMRLQDLSVKTPAKGPKRWNEQNFERTAKTEAQDKKGYIQADQICIRVVDDVRRVATFIIENKPPHKLSIHTINTGLHDMDPISHVLNRVDEMDSVAYAEFLVVAAIVRTFDYMVESRLQYGYICTGEAFVFLHIREQEPETVYYHTSAPRLELHDGTKWPSIFEEPNLLHATALGRVIVFCLQAVRKKPLHQGWLVHAKKQLGRWEPDYLDMVAKVPGTVREEAAVSYLKPANAIKIDLGSSPYFLRSRAANQYAPPVNSLGPGADTDGDDEEDDSDDVHASSIMGTPTSAPKAKTTGSSSSKGRQAGQHRAYCTQLCLLGLSQHGTLDEMCPNLDEHRYSNKDKDCSHHSITGHAFLGLIQTQLAENLDEDVHPWGITGSRGGMFKVSLSSHGYTVVAKATKWMWVTDLEHENLVYQHLQHIQGIYVPVCLGSIDLERPYSYSARCELVHMMFLAHAGRPLRTRGISATATEISAQTMQSIKAIHCYGVSHKDVALRNMLWNEEVKRVMFVDFERSLVYAKEEGQPLQPISPNLKHKRSSQKLGLIGKEVADAANYKIVLKNEFDRSLNERYC